MQHEHEDEDEAEDEDEDEDEYKDDDEDDDEDEDEDEGEDADEHAKMLCLGLGVGLGAGLGQARWRVSPQGYWICYHTKRNEIDLREVILCSPMRTPPQSCMIQGRLSNWSYSNASVYRKLSCERMDLHIWETISPPLPQTCEVTMTALREISVLSVIFIGLQPITPCQRLS